MLIRSPLPLAPLPIKVRDQEVLVYALTEEGMVDLEQGEMGRRVHKLEGSNS